MYDKDNVFAKIIRKDLPCKEVYQDDEIMAFHDVLPAAPVHVLVVPKGEYVSFDDFVEKAGPNKVAYFFKKVREIARSFELEENGYRLVTNHGKDASQTVKHFHVHILGGRSLGGLLPDDKSHR